MSSVAENSTESSAGDDVTMASVTNAATVAGAEGGSASGTSDTSSANISQEAPPGRKQQDQAKDGAVRQGVESPDSDSGVGQSVMTPSSENTFGLQELVLEEDDESHSDPTTMVADTRQVPDDSGKGISMEDGLSSTSGSGLPDSKPATSVSFTNADANTCNQLPTIQPVTPPRQKTKTESKPLIPTRVKVHPGPDASMGMAAGGKKAPLNLPGGTSRADGQGRAADVRPKTTKKAVPPRKQEPSVGKTKTITPPVSPRTPQQQTGFVGQKPVTKGGGRRRARSESSHLAPPRESDPKSVDSPRQPLARGTGWDREGGGFVRGTPRRSSIPPGGRAGQRAAGKAPRPSSLTHTHLHTMNTRPYKPVKRRPEVILREYLPEVSRHESWFWLLICLSWRWKKVLNPIVYNT